MLDFIIDFLVDIGGFFVNLWVNKIIGKFKKRKEKEETDK